MTTQDTARLMKLAKLSQKIAEHITTAHSKQNIAMIMSQRSVAAIHDDRIRKYCRWSNVTAYAMQMYLEGIQAQIGRAHV